MTAGAELPRSGTGDVERATLITVRYMDEAERVQTVEANGFEAVAIQHELDHLDGKMIIDRTDPESRREAMAQLRPRLVLSR